MHIVILFTNIGSYHAARIDAAYRMCQERGWHLTAIQITDDTLEHSWGDFGQSLSASVKTLIPAAERKLDPDLSPQNRYECYAREALSLLPGCLDELAPTAICIPGWSMPIAKVARRWCATHRAIPILMSESSEHDFPRKWPIEQYKKWLIRSYKTAIVGGQSHKRYLIKLGMKPAAIFCGYDIVNNDLFAPDRIRTLPTPHVRPYFLAVSRLIPKKNLLALLAAYRSYRDRVVGEPWDLILCGSGAQQAELEQFIAANGLQECVRLPGFLKPQELLPYLAHATCFVHASTEEQWGLVINEAMAAGLPVIVSNRCGCYEDLVLEGITGYSFDPDDRERLASLMVEIGSLDRDTLTKMSVAALEHIDNFAPSYFASGVAGCLDYAMRA